MDKEISASALPRSGGQKSGWTFPHSDVTSRILSAAIHVHRQLGPGFLEKIDERALRMELTVSRMNISSPFASTTMGSKLAIRRVVRPLNLAAEAQSYGGAENLD